MVPFAPLFGFWVPFLSNQRQKGCPDCNMVTRLPRGRFLGLMGLLMGLIGRIGSIGSMGLSTAIGFTVLGFLGFLDLLGLTGLIGLQGFMVIRVYRVCTYRVCIVFFSGLYESFGVPLHGAACQGTGHARGITPKSKVPYATPLHVFASLNPVSPYLGLRLQGYPKK